MIRTARAFLTDHLVLTKTFAWNVVALGGVLALASLWVSDLGSVTWRILRGMATDERTFIVGVLLVGIVYLVFRLARTAVRVRFGPAAHMSSRALSDGSAGYAIAAAADRDAALNPHSALSVRARHEAVHAVAVQALGWKVDKVTTVRGWSRSGASGGNCAFSIPEPVEPLPDLFYNRIVITLAPHVDDLDRHLSSTGPAPDLRAAWEDSFSMQSLGVVPRRMQRLGASEADLTLERIGHYARLMAREIVDDHGDEIDALAHRLQASPHGATIDGEDLPALHR
jgi:hypothetical protein